MRSSDKILGVLAAVLFLGVGLAVFRAQRVMHQHRWIVLKEPIRLEEGFSLSLPFSVDVASKYWIEVECLETGPFDTLNQALTKELAAEITVTHGTERVASGDTSQFIGAGYSVDSISRHIATFDAAPGNPYFLALHVTGSPPILASTHPVVKISIDPRIFKDAYATASLYSYAALALALLGVLCLLSILNRHLRASWRAQMKEEIP